MKGIKFLLAALLVCAVSACVKKQQPVYVPPVDSAIDEPEMKKLSPAEEKAAAIQQALNEQGANLVVDGVIGRRTRDALRNFQRTNGLKVSGAPDAATMKKLGVK